MTITNYTLREFLTQNVDTVNEYKIYLDALLAKNDFRINTKYYKQESIWDLPFGKVESLKKLLTSDQTENILKALGLVFGISQKQVLEIRIVDFYPVLKFIQDEIVNIIHNENKNLSSTPDVKLMMCESLKEMEQFGVLPTIDNLTDGKPWEWDKVDKTPYRKIFYKLWMDNVKGKINTEYSSQK